MKNAKQQHYTLYQTMTELGKDTFYIELIENYPCQTQDELFKREGEKIGEDQSKLNRFDVSVAEVREKTPRQQGTNSRKKQTRLPRKQRRKETGNKETLPRKE
jgi:hypothetical protein